MAPTLFLLAFTVVFSVALGQVVSHNYSAFDSSNAYTLQFNYGASYSGGSLQLTPSAPSSAGSIFMKDPVSLTGPNGFSASFSTEFTFTMDENNGDQDSDGIKGGDGLVFVINSISNSEGCNGGGLGYEGIGRSVGIEFDTWNNLKPTDINGNHVGLDINGNVDSVTSTSFPTPFNNGQLFYVWIDYDGEFDLLEVRVSTSSVRPILPLLIALIDLVDILETPSVFVGFTASTGQAWERHRIHSWWFSNRYAPCSICGNGIVEPGEDCDGGSCCNSCRYASSWQTCGTSRGPCDDLAKCNGWSAYCPSNTYAGSSTVCRNATGPCDQEAKCTGWSTACPANQYVSSSTVCRNAGGPCDHGDKCTGWSAACPTDGYVNSSVVCRNSNGPCENSAKCTGSSGTCPPNTYVNSSSVCRNSSGSCEEEAKCTGWSSSCPANVYLNSSTVCSNSSSCQQEAKCTGSSSSCPMGAFLNSSAVCRNATGPCDYAAHCTGNSSTCPANAFAPNGTICMASAGDCDVAELCTGKSADCPPDVFAPNLTTCNPSNSACEIQMNCTGASIYCPPPVLSATATCFCSRQTFSGPPLTTNYFCAPGMQQYYYMCDQGPWSDLSSGPIMCPAGTTCGCAPGMDCECDDSGSPCTDGTETCGNPYA